MLKELLSLYLIYRGEHKMKVKVVTYITDGYPVVSLYHTKVSDEEIIKAFEEAYVTCPDIEITEETVYTEAVC
jgi:hypothetical protein